MYLFIIYIRWCKKGNNGVQTNTDRQRVTQKERTKPRKGLGWFTPWPCLLLLLESCLEEEEKTDFDRMR